jgi:hypothetical protein
MRFGGRPAQRAGLGIGKNEDVFPSNASESHNVLKTFIGNITEHYGVGEKASEEILAAKDFRCLSDL